MWFGYDGTPTSMIFRVTFFFVPTVVVVFLTVSVDLDGAPAVGLRRRAGHLLRDDDLLRASAVATARGRRGARRDRRAQRCREQML